VTVGADIIVVLGVKLVVLGVEVVVEEFTVVDTIAIGVQALGGPWW